MKKIAVFGSVNIDYFVESSRLPKSGETVYGDNFFMSFGGKGANQAVAAARLGGDVSLFGSIGNDEQRELLLTHFKAENVKVNHLNSVDGQSTGAAFIQLHEGDNRIIIVPGANHHTNQAYLERVLAPLLEHDIFIFQLEIPLDTVETLINILHQHGKTILLDPAPMQPLTAELVHKVTYLTPNEHEVAMMVDETGSLEERLAKYPNQILVTFGEHGVIYHDGSNLVTIPAQKVTAVDTTGAGDTFTGAFAVALSEGKSLRECIEFGNIAAGMAVTKKGAQAGMPLRGEISPFVGEEELNHDEEFNETVS